ncbi:MAG: 50S ribosomal protein L24 [Nitrospinae bacterium]|nr:50S ribosomal protein L24 [Nitrospinota bacterium]
MRLKKDDMVAVIAGADKGKKGRVLEAHPKKGKVLVEKVAVVKRHQKPTQQNQAGGIIEKESLIDASNVQVICAKCDKPVRIGIKALEDGKKVRVCRACGEMLDA